MGLGPRVARIRSMRGRMSTKTPPATPSRLAASSLAARDAPLRVLTLLVKLAKSALLHRQRFVLTKSCVQINKCYGKLEISEHKKTCDASQNLRFPQASREENHRGGLGRLFDESQSPRFCANGLCFSLLRKTGPKLARPTRYSAKRGQNRGPTLIAHRFWLLENWLLWHGGGKTIFTVHFKRLVSNRAFDRKIH